MLYAHLKQHHSQKVGGRFFFKLQITQTGQQLNVLEICASLSETSINLPDNYMQCTLEKSSCKADMAAREALISSCNIQYEAKDTLFPPPYLSLPLCVSRNHTHTHTHMQKSHHS